MLILVCLFSATAVLAQHSSSDDHSHHDSHPNNYAQSVNEAATISLPIRIYKNTDLEFGGVISGSASGNVHVYGTIGTVSLNGGGDPSATTNSSVTYPSGNGPIKFTGQGGGSLGQTARLAPAVASFIVTGDPSATYSILVSGGTSISNTTVGGSTMSVTLDKPSGGNVNGAGNQGTISSNGVAGTDRFTVGGTLHVGAGQVSGYYTGTFCVTAAYN